ncbi:hypothetical protein D3C74_460400 [compost metagenome]
MKEAGVWGAEQELAFPIIVKTGVNDQGSTIRYYFNYADEATSFVNAYGEGTEILEGIPIAAGEKIELEPWGVRIIEQ